MSGTPSRSPTSSRRSAWAMSRRSTVAGAPVLVRHGSTVPLADLGRALGVPGERETKVGVVVRYGSAD